MNALVPVAPWLSYLYTTSDGPDAQEIARIGPVGMISVPGIGGRPLDIEKRANVLLHTVLGFDKQ